MFARRIDACAPLKTLVIGDAILDEYVEGETGGLCREAPVPIVLSRVDTMRRAGRRMQPANAAGLGSQMNLRWNGCSLRSRCARMLPLREK